MMAFIVTMVIMIIIVSVSGMLRMLMTTACQAAIENEPGVNVGAMKQLTTGAAFCILDGNRASSYQLNLEIQAGESSACGPEPST